MAILSPMSIRSHGQTRQGLANEPGTKTATEAGNVSCPSVPLAWCGMKKGTRVEEASDADVARRHLVVIYIVTGIHGNQRFLYVLYGRLVLPTCDPSRPRGRRT